MLRRLFKGLLIVVLVLGAYLLLAPVPIEPVAWDAPKDRGYVDVHARNNRLANLQTISIGSESGPEHIALGPDGKLYAAVDGGRILRMNKDGSGQEVWAQTGGRVLGFDFDREGRLIAADAMRGLLAIAAPAEPSGDKKITVLADKVIVNGQEDPWSSPHFNRTSCFS